MNTTTTTRRPVDLPPVVVKRPRCPSCGSAHLKSYKAICERDASDSDAVTWSQRHTRCRRCDHRFIVIEE